MLCSSCERGVRICERNNPADPQVSEERGGGGAPGARAEIPLQVVGKTMVKQAVPLQPMEVHGGAGGHALKEAAACGEPALEQAPGRTCGPWRGAHSGVGLLAGAVTLWGTHTGAVPS